MMRKPQVKREFDPADFDRTENYYFKRFGAYAIDSLLVAFVLLIPFFLLGADPTDPAMVAIFIFCLGLGSIVYKSIFEYYRNETPGKNLLGLRIEPLGEDIPMEAYFMRNLSAIVPMILPALDLAYGYSSSVDNRMKYLDATNRLIVVEVLPVVVQEIIRRPMKIEAKPETERFQLGFDEGYARGNCPRCGAPYRVLPPGNTSFSGLWNHRCTWCNSLITESML
jgi:uncharacterized RDD family membrane protein YckC